MAEVSKGSQTSRCVVDYGLAVAAFALPAFSGAHLCRRISLHLEHVIFKCRKVLVRTRYGRIRGFKHIHFESQNNNLLAMLLSESLHWPAKEIGIPSDHRAWIDQPLSRSPAFVRVDRSQHVRDAPTATALRRMERSTEIAPLTGEPPPNLRAGASELPPFPPGGPHPPGVIVPFSRGGALVSSGSCGSRPAIDERLSSLIPAS
ncbi:hypothetical protein THAOC_09023 [Thalassiosira oceanica]|uniref:Uncharacterized protein n=1 Tax=Thalassiosira oceanica TaxID=159749 RepID=K0STM4_THAOC|nr:hypothetical protein THAOC_09023 [Thalassiosira oceanica]|eukprot:EJK69693.1 hypothetical protein THAOC_09023 [Thalassiosira oceanica]